MENIYTYFIFFLCRIWWMKPIAMLGREPEGVPILAGQLKGMLSWASACT